MTERPAHVLETRRLFLREQSVDDLNDVMAIMGDRETMRFYPRPFTPLEVEEWIERNVGWYVHRGYGLWAVVHKDTGEFVGQCGLTPQDVEGREEVEVGWHTKRRYWGRGYATEAALAARDYGFEVVGLERLVSLIRPENAPSARVAEKIGMKPDRMIMRSNLPHIVFAITATETQQA